MNDSYKRNYIVLFDGNFYRVYGRLSKTIPFKAYDPEKHIGIGLSFDEAIEDCGIPKWQIEDDDYEVVFDE